MKCCHCGREYTERTYGYYCSSTCLYATQRFLHKAPKGVLLDVYDPENGRIGSYCKKCGKVVWIDFSRAPESLSALCDECRSSLRRSYAPRNSIVPSGITLEQAKGKIRRLQTANEKLKAENQGLKKKIWRGELSASATVVAGAKKLGSENEKLALENKKLGSEIKKLESTNKNLESENKKLESANKKLRQQLQTLRADKPKYRRRYKRMEDKLLSLRKDLVKAQSDYFMLDEELKELKCAYDKERSIRLMMNIYQSSPNYRVIEECKKVFTEDTQIRKDIEVVEQSLIEGNANVKIINSLFNQAITALLQYHVEEDLRKEELDNA